MKISKFILSVFLYSVPFHSFSQYTVGTLKMGFTSIKMNGEEMPGDMMKMLGSGDITVYSDGVVQKSELNMMMTKVITLVDARKDSTYSYMDLMGKKYKIATPKQDTANIEMNPKDIVVKEYPEDVKELLGYKCHRVEVTMPNIKVKGSEEQNTITLTLYVTNELNFNPSYINQMGQETPMFKGTPLEFTIINKANGMDMQMVMQVKSFSKEVNPNDLLPPSGKYQNFSQEEFMKKMGGK